MSEQVVPPWTCHFLRGRPSMVLALLQQCSWEALPTQTVGSWLQSLCSVLGPLQGHLGPCWTLAYLKAAVSASAGDSGQLFQTRDGSRKGTGTALEKDMTSPERDAGGIW